MRHIHSLLVMRNLDRRKYADKQVSIKKELLKIFSRKSKRKMNWLPTDLEPVSFISTCMQVELLSAKATNLLEFVIQQVIILSIFIIQLVI